MTESTYRKHGCTKSRYVSQTQAINAALSLSAKHGAAYRTYFSSKCKCWHLTTKEYDPERQAYRAYLARKARRKQGA